MSASTFTTKVYAVASMIPKGRVSTYKQIAQQVGSPRAYRAVATLMRKNPDTTVVPCHRVVGSDGAMHGYSAGNGISTKISLLKSEGVYVENGKVDLEKYLWKPSDDARPS
jgi:methylated-DNA-[protein]-cysteine S-methyltransferase